MITVTNIETYGFETAIRGMRNPKNSWDRSDSYFGCYCEFDIGDNDIKLMSNLFQAGTEHRKFDRMIQVSMDITAPLYWWKEFDTYKVGTVANSCSTMHKIHAKEFTLDDFSTEHLQITSVECLIRTVDVLNEYRKRFIVDKDKDDWWQMIQLLPSSYNQKRTILMNYEVCARIIEQRKGHKLDEWRDLCDIILDLPYFKEITGHE